MKNLKFLFASAILILLSCSKDDNNSNVINGVDRTANLQTTGSSAHDFLSNQTYHKLIIELVYVKNFRPTTQAISNFKNFLDARLNKSGGISIIEREVNAIGNSPYDLNQVAQLESALRNNYNSAGTLTMFAFFLDGSAAGDTNESYTLGSAYRNTSIVIYESTAKSISGGIGQPSLATVETTVLNHEMAHLLGLVNLGSPMQNQHLDTAHDKHCDNSDCLMFWQAESGDIFQMITGGSSPQLDANCIEDLRANGGK